MSEHLWPVNKNLILMTKESLNLYEQASYDLTVFRERRVAERRKQARNTPDRRKKKIVDHNDSKTNGFPQGMH